jgi:hypothetical protein
MGAVLRAESKRPLPQRDGAAARRLLHRYNAVERRAPEERARCASTRVNADEIRQRLAHRSGGTGGDAVHLAIVCGRVQPEATALDADRLRGRSMRMLRRRRRASSFGDRVEVGDRVSIPAGETGLAAAEAASGSAARPTGDQLRIRTTVLVADGTTAIVHATGAADSVPLNRRDWRADHVVLNAVGSPTRRRGSRSSCSRRARPR